MENGFIELIHSASSRNARYRRQAAYEVNSERLKLTRSGILEST
jgi:hypothetical protein